MGKLVFLKLDGELKKGFRVALEIWQENSQKISIRGKLPPVTELTTKIKHHWEEKYRFLGAPYRLKAKKKSWFRGKITPIGIFKDSSPNRRNLEECKESAKDLSSKMNIWLKSEQFREVDNQLRENLNQNDNIQFLICTEDLLLCKLPWQQWELFKSFPKIEPTFAPLQFTYNQKNRKLANKYKPRILVILGHKEGITLEKDQRLLEDLTKAEIRFLVEPKRKDINDELWEKCWDILFFAGHSETEGDTGRIYINPNDSLTIDELSAGFKKAVQCGLQLAIFNSCDGLGLATALSECQIPYIIVMRELVPDRVAQQFLKYFLQNFVENKSLDITVREARERLQVLESEFPCATLLPIIYQKPTAPVLTWTEIININQSTSNPNIKYVEPLIPVPP
ncbi:MAG: CHAT domain-containing protein [Moorea sp. SIO2B7]|nr:CHAT domain-containing protein [Moorena sp. SIO2B7]